MGQTNQIFTVPYRCISICGTSHSFSTCLWSPTVNFQQINIFNGIGIGLCCLNRHRCRVSNYMSKCKRLPSTEWSRFEGTMSFSLAAGFASWFQTRGRSSLVSLTSNVTFGHRSVATYRGPICQCQQKYMHKHTHTFPFVVSRHNGESSLQWTTLKKKKKRQICPQVHCPAAFCPLAKAVPLCQGTFLQDYSPLQPGQDHYSLPALCLSVTAQPSVRQPSTESSSHGWSRTKRRTYISNRCKEDICDIHICFSQCHKATRLNKWPIFVYVGLHPSNFKWKIKVTFIC